MKPNEKWSEKESYGIHIHMSQYILYTLSVESRVGVVRCQGWGGQGAEGGHRLIPAPLLRDEDRHHCAPFMYIYIQIFLSVPWNFSRAQAPESTFKCLRWAWADFQFSANIIFISHCVKFSNECIFCIHNCVLSYAQCFSTQNLYSVNRVCYIIGRKFCRNLLDEGP